MKFIDPISKPLCGGCLLRRLSSLDRILAQLMIYSLILYGGYQAEQSLTQMFEAFCPSLCVVLSCKYESSWRKNPLSVFLLALTYGCSCLSPLHLCATDSVVLLSYKSNIGSICGAAGIPNWYNRDCWSC